jgi:hypothetical protein
LPVARCRVEKLLELGRRSDIAFELTIWDVDVLKGKVKVWVIGDKLGVGTSKTTIGTHLGVVSQEYKE